MRHLLCALLLLAGLAQAEIVVRDDSGRDVRLAQPARRIVSLAPYITENLFAIGAGDRVVGTVEFSDYPAAARKVRRVGGYERLDLEAIVALRPDLVVAWQSGNASGQIERLRAAGLPIFVMEPGRIEEVAAGLDHLGQLAGVRETADATASAFRERLAGLKRRYAAQSPVRTFYQVWNEPIMTVGGRQIISDVIRLCGGDNVFGHLGTMAPVVSEEAVIAANPEAIVASGMNEARPDWVDYWRRWPRMTAVARDNLFFVPPDIIQRHTPRLLDGAEQLCLQLEKARERRPRNS